MSGRRCQRAAGARCRARPRPRPRGRRSAGQGRLLGSAARRADDGQGVVQRRRTADDLRPRGFSRQHRGHRRGDGTAPAWRRRGDLRQEQCAGLAGRLAELQQGLRHHEQPLGSDPNAGWLVGRRGRSDGCGVQRAGVGQRHRCVDPQPGALLRRLGPQTDLGRGADGRPRARARGLRRQLRHRRGRPDRAQCIRPDAGDGHPGIAARDHDDHGPGAAGLARPRHAAAALQGGSALRRRAGRGRYQRAARTSRSGGLHACRGRGGD